MSKTTDGQDLINGLRELADWLEANPDAPGDAHANVVIYKYGSDPKEARSIIRLPGTWEKSVKYNDFRLAQKFGPVTYRVNFNRRSVCKLVKKKKLIEVEEWECPDSLLEEKAA